MKVEPQPNAYIHQMNAQPKMSQPNNPPPDYGMATQQAPPHLMPQINQVQQSMMGGSQGGQMGMKMQAQPQMNMNVNMSGGPAQPFNPNMPMSSMQMNMMPGGPRKF